MRIPILADDQTALRLPTRSNGMSATTAFVVVDFWHVKPGRRDAVHRVLAAAAPILRAQPGVLSADFAQPDGDPDRYLVVFRYADRQAREVLQAAPELQDIMARLN